MNVLDEKNSSFQEGFKAGYETNVFHSVRFYTPNDHEHVLITRQNGLMYLCVYLDDVGFVVDGDEDEKPVDDAVLFFVPPVPKEYN